MKIKSAILFAFTGLICVQAPAQKIDCDKPNAVTASSQVIREKTYQYIKMVTKPSRNINKDTLLNLATAYIDIQTRFNAIFASMKEDKERFASRKLLCNRYSTDLNDLISQANDYDNRILNVMKMDNKVHSFGGVTEVLEIIDWLYKKFKEGNTNFYDKVKWADWDSLEAK